MDPTPLWVQCDTNNDGFGNDRDADLDNNDMTNPIDLGRRRDAQGQPPGPSGLVP